MLKTSYRLFIIIISSLLFGALLVSCTLSEFANQGEQQNIQLIQPQESAQFKMGDSVSVISNFSDPGGAQGVMLEVNGVSIRNDRFQPAIFEGQIDQPWIPAQNGTAIICVYLSTSSGQLLRSNCVNIVIGSSSPPAPNSEAPTPEVSFTATTDLTAIPMLPVTQSTPSATANQDANCRFGPGQNYSVTGSLLAGQTAPIVGRNADNSWWVIQIPGGGQCWIWGGTVTVGGDTGSVPEFAPPATQTATETEIPPLTAPSPISPSGTLNCADASGGVTLAWAPVVYPNGIDHYEWSLEGPISDSGNTGTTQASTKSLSCGGAIFQWRVRAVDGQGNTGPWSNYLEFNLP